MIIEMDLKKTISGSKKELSDILYQQIAAGQETEQIRKEGEAILQQVSELFVINQLLKEQTEILTENKEKLLSKNEKLEKQQKKLQKEINKMVRLERHLGREQVQSIIERLKVLERAKRVNKCPKSAIEMSR